jgi:hypothetical protein
MVIVEERYVTAGFLLILFPIFAALRASSSRVTINSVTAPALVALLALLAVGESTRLVLDLRRYISIAGSPGGWHDSEIFNAAHALNDMGVGPGDTIACIGARACVYDHYWARLAGVRILTEIYQPRLGPYVSLSALPNRDKAIEITRQQGAKVLVGYFNPNMMTGSTSLTAGWQELDGTHFYALPLNLAGENAATQP